MNTKQTKTHLDRRDFLKLGLLTTAAAITASCSLHAADSPTDSSSTPASNLPVKYVAKKFDNLLGGAIKGLSDNQLKAHFTLYENYVKAINSTEEKVRKFDINSGDKGAYRELQLAQTFSLGGAVLHELYFGNLGATDKEPKGTLKKMVDRDWGSVSNFIGHLKLNGLAMRGWSLAAYNFRTGKIGVYGLDQHHEMVPNMVYPILALDVYEHAYMIDYSIDRGKYIDAFVLNLNWRPVEERLERALGINFGPIATA
ncbi:MAG: twin-arginine translocation signal domain-containing protein [Candidatus Melainabacteria bacterium]|nr:twin-arginine translocation signal domain-containing protein [Candidatus Melainabacteria bacterium]MBI3309501.1 twin-arginine translocation signal domain-containing protein [Candidatus Melainabacteria bacterium]